MSNYFSNENLLKPPVKRAAYSDRTAYLMAEMSRLAYFKFEGGNNIDDILTLAKAFLPEKEKLEKLGQIIKASIAASPSEEAENILGEILSQKGFKLIKTFNDDGTGAQAFLCIHLDQKTAILAFRGTETNLKDIKADARANLITVKHNGSEVRMHDGYHNQFKSLKEDNNGKEGIQSTLSKDELKDHQLFITGHSLGGALAITATKFLAGDTTGACYTFGSPPVGTKNFDKDIKTPIYRIINHVDIVPRLPNPILIHFLRLLGFLIGVLLTPFTGVYSRIKSFSWYKKLELFLLDAQEYRQSGYGSYLVGSGSGARLRYSVGMFDRFIWWINQFGNIFRGEMKILSDHSIDLYSKKLETWAENRR